MPSQIGLNRLYTDTTEATSPRKATCDKCKIVAVPKGVLTNHANPSMKQETYCPNCGHIHRAGTNRDNH